MQSTVSNRLAKEKSPYLLQHSQNPVDWYPWGDEAFAKAKKENKLIFLSIGYSTCHWCHVMEKESFEDQHVADLMNRHFVSIKVDREERPDIDKIYMDVCRLMTGSGGWPLTIIATPDKKPFFAGTYIPKYTVYDRIGLLHLLPQMNHIWKENKKRVIELTEDIARSLSHQEKREKRTLKASGLLETGLRSEKQISGAPTIYKFSNSCCAEPLPVLEPSKKDSDD